MSLVPRMLRRLFWPIESGLKVRVWEHRKNRLDDRVQAIESDMRAMMAARSLRPSVWSWGAYGIDPKNIAFFMAVDTDQQKRALLDNPAVEAEFRALLARHDWPEQARQGVLFSVESEETVQRESGGSWYHHLK